MPNKTRTKTENYSLNFNPKFVIPVTLLYPSVAGMLVLTLVLCGILAILVIVGQVLLLPILQSFLLMPMVSILSLHILVPLIIMVIVTMVSPSAVWYTSWRATKNQNSTRLIKPVNHAPFTIFYIFSFPLSTNEISRNQ